MSSLLEYLCMFVVFQSPADYPGRVVVREQRTYPPGRPTTPPAGFRIIDGHGGATIWVADCPHYVGPHLARARKVIPGDLVRVPRSPGDVASLLEVWL